MKKELFLLILLLFTACEQRTKSSNQLSTTNEKKELTKKEISEVKQDKFLKELGFEVNGEKVTIDMNKTTEFMKQIEIEMHSRADEIEHKIEKADINFTKGLGIEIGDDRVDIDLNKTRNMLQQINILMKDILLDVNGTIQH